MEAKKIVITGGANRIGAAIAKSLAGYDTEITVHYNKSHKAAKKLKSDLENLGTKVHLVKGDLSNPVQTKKVINEAFKKMRGMDCLINNASIFENDNLNNFSNESLNKHLNINKELEYFI